MSEKVYVQIAEGLHEAVLAEARRYAFFVGWEMCETAGAEDTCADAFAFWSLMEDGRDEAEGKKL